MDWATKVAQAIASSLKRGNHLDNEREPVFIYGISFFLSALTGLLTAVVAGAVFGCLLEAVVYGVMFTILRIHAGGFHFKSAAVCFLVSTVLDVLAVVQVVTFTSSLSGINGLVGIIVFMALIWVLAPVETPSKPLDGTEREVYGKRSKVISVFYLGFAVILFSIGADTFFTAIYVAMLYVALLALLGYVSNYSKSKKG